MENNQILLWLTIINFLDKKAGFFSLNAYIYKIYKLNEIHLIQVNYPRTDAAKYVSSIHPTNWILLRTIPKQKWIGPAGLVLNTE